MTNHYTRIGQEKLFIDLMKTFGVEQIASPKTLSDYNLMVKINDLLKSLNLTPYTEEELEMDLK